MAVYYKFKSAKDYSSISIDTHFISVANFKHRIFQSKSYGKGNDFDLILTNAQTNQDYIDESILIPRNTSVVIRRIPGQPRMRFLTQPNNPKIEIETEDHQNSKLEYKAVVGSPVPKDVQLSYFDDEFGEDVYAVAKERPSAVVEETMPLSRVEEDDKIKALVGFSGFVGGEDIGSGRGGVGGFDRRTPPQGYVCHRCKVAGHFIQHCPTNGDPNYNFKKVKPPTGIPNSMLEVTSDGSCMLPDGAAVVLKANEAEIGGLPSARVMRDVPQELHCPLCKEVMRDAVFASKCCFKSFCDKCIRDYCINSGWVCVCGVRDVLADHLLPNITVRDTIKRMLESGNCSSSGNTSGSVVTAVHRQEDMQSRTISPKFLSPNQQSAADNKPCDESEVTHESVSALNVCEEVQQNSEVEKIIQVPDSSKRTHNSASLRGALHFEEEEVGQNAVATDATEKMRNAPSLMNAPDIEMQHQPKMNGYIGPCNFNPYWQGMQPSMDNPFAPNMPFMGYGPIDPFGNVIPLFTPQNVMAPPLYPPLQRDMNFRTAFVSRKARKSEERGNQRMDRRSQSKGLTRGCDDSREATSNASAQPIKSKSKPPSARRSPSVDRYNGEHDHERHHHCSRHSHRSERVPSSRTSCDQEVLCPSLKRESEHHEPDHHHDHERHELERSYHHRSESYSSKSPSAAAGHSSFKRHKANTFSRANLVDSNRVNGVN